MRGAFSLELAAVDGLDVVAVRVDQERRVVKPGFFRAVLLADTRGPVVPEPGVDARAVERIDLVARTSDEPDMERRRHLRRAGNDEVGELRAALVLPERRDLERREHGLVEPLARLDVTHAELHVVEDDPRPIPVDHSGTLRAHSSKVEATLSDMDALTIRPATLSDVPAL